MTFRVSRDPTTLKVNHGIQEETDMTLAHIDSLEAPLREAHVTKPNTTFQAFVDGIRFDPTHPLHATAVEYNRAVYRMQSQIGETE